MLFGSFLCHVFYILLPGIYNLSHPVTFKTCDSLVRKPTRIFLLPSYRMSSQYQSLEGFSSFKSPLPGGSGCLISIWFSSYIPGSPNSASQSLSHRSALQLSLQPDTGSWTPLPFLLHSCSLKTFFPCSSYLRKVEWGSSAGSSPKKSHGKWCLSPSHWCLPALITRLANESFSNNCKILPSSSQHDLYWLVLARWLELSLASLKSVPAGSWQWWQLPVWVPARGIPLLSNLNSSAINEEENEKYHSPDLSQACQGGIFSKTRKTSYLWQDRGEGDNWTKKNELLEKRWRKKRKLIARIETG